MDGKYSYTPYLWPMLASAAFFSLLGIYSWRRRSVPGALPFAIMSLFATLWATGAALELAAVDLPIKIFWFKFEIAVCIMPIVIARFCFALEYAGLGHWLTRQNLILLSIPPLLEFLLVLTNDSHHWMWRGIVFDGTLRPSYGAGAWIMNGFGYLLFLVILIIFARLFFRSPAHRWPLALILIAMITTHTAYMLDALQRNPFAPVYATILSMNISFVMYALALFRFHIFDPIPAARKTAIEQMREAMLVLDAGGKIVDLNPAAERILGLPAARVREREAGEFLPAFAKESAGNAQVEICLGTGSAMRHYELLLSPLKDRSQELLGYLLLLHDTTAQKQAQIQLVEQQRALAALKEREQVARELHDELAQELAFINLQAQAACDLLAAGQPEQAGSRLQLLAKIAREAQVDVRGQISKLSLNILPEEGFLGALRRFLETFQRMYGIRADLIVGGDGAETFLEPTAEVQLLRIVQEAFTNIRKHACAGKVRVSLGRQPGCVELCIEDDGVGFHPGESASGGITYGLRMMAERAAEIGGSLEIHSTPGAGTRVLISVPVGGEQSSVDSKQ